MGTDEKHSVRNGIFVTVIGGLILAAVIYGLSFIPGLFRWVGTLIAGFWHHLTSSIAIPWALFWLLLILSTICIIRIVRPLFKRGSDVPRLRSYTEDRFENIVWRWSYNFANQPINIQPYCPYCDIQLVHVVPPFWDNQGDKVSFYCENCKRTLANVEGGGRSYAISMIARHIDRKIRTGEWEQLIERD
jgi:hypothetical protein